MYINCLSGNAAEFGHDKFRGVSGLGRDPVRGWILGIFDMADVCSDGIPKDLGLRVEADQAKPCEVGCF